VLKGLNLTINPGERVALVGESGCGKSTFVSLLMRFYDVDFGEILVDGVNIKDYNLHDIRNSMSMVQQEPILFNYSIYENILYGKPLAKNSEIINSAELSNATEFIYDKDAIAQYDESAVSMVKQMELHKEQIEKEIGKDKFKEKLDILKQIVK